MKIKFLLFKESLHQLFKKIFTPKFGFFFLGISSTIWFLIRVIPKPQRATYPCMQVAAPIMSSMVIYLLSLFGSIIAYKKAKKNFLKAKYLLAVTFLILTVVSAFTFMLQNNVSLFASEMDVKANEPVGTGRGIFPGRVAWIFNPDVAKYNGSTGNFWDDSNTIQSETDEMVSEAIKKLTGITDESEAWNALFVNFNSTKKGTSTGYATGQKIAIKVNMNATGSHTSNRNINGSPQLILSLLKSLINSGGVAQNCITVFDASRFITNNVYDKCHAMFPDVIFVDHIGGNGRVKSTYTANAIPYSANVGALAKGIVDCAIQADYLINMALLKGHSATGVTLCGKNWYGATSISSDYRLNAHNSFGAASNGSDRYLAFVDFMGHKHLGEKTILFMIDAIYANKGQGGVPSVRWQMPPFNNRWPSSLFVSQDGVAIDAVGTDFLRSEWPDLPKLLYCEKYLIEAAQADNPPSNTFYDAEKDGVRCKSLGTYESWNNAAEKKYSRNLGLNTGIELTYHDLTTTSIDDSDFASDKNSNNSFTMYPNPLSLENTLTINLHVEAKGTLRISTMNGQVVFSKILKNETTLNLDIKDILKSGGYAVSITSGKFVANQKLIVK